MKFKSWQELQNATAASIGGWQTECEREWLFHAAQKIPHDGVFVEIGVYLGSTIAHVAALSLAQGIRRRIYAIDAWVGDGTWSGEQQRDAMLENVRRSGAPELVTTLSGHSHEVAKSWVTPIDFLIIDGDHEYAGAIGDMRGYCPFVNVGGTVVVDDTWPGQPELVIKAVQEYFWDHPDVWRHETPPRDVYPDMQGGSRFYPERGQQGNWEVFTKLK